MQNINMKRFLCFILSIILMLSVMTVAGCNDKTDGDDEEDSSSPSSSSSVIPLPIKNGNFENMYDTSIEGSYPRSVKDWSKSGDSYGGKSADTLQTTGGIINITDEIYDSKVKSKLVTSTLSKYNADHADNKLEAKNPGSMFADKENVNNDKDDLDNNVLMLLAKEPTAVRYKSSSISLPANTHVRFTIYVKAYTFRNDSFADYASNQGAMIRVSGGVDAPITINNISTYGADGAEWEKYEIYVQGSSFTAKTLYLELGIGSGSPADQSNYSEGFAFFDQTKLEYLTPNAYEESIKALSNEQILGDFFTATADELTDVNYTAPERHLVSAKNNNVANAVIYSFRDFSDDTVLNAPSLDHLNGNSFIEPIGTTNESNLGTAKYGIACIGADVFKNDIFKKKYDYTVKAEKEGEKDKQESTTVLPSANFPFSASDNIVYFYNDSDKNCMSKGVSLAENLDIGSDEYFKISIWVKSSALEKGSIVLSLIDRQGQPIDGDKTKMKIQSFAGVNTTKMDMVYNERENESNRTNKYDDWVQYSWFVSGGMTGSSSVDLELFFGLRDVTNKGIESFPNSGNYVMATNLTWEKLSASQYSAASAGDTTKSGISLAVAVTTSIANGAFNDVVTAHTNIKDKLVSPANWTGAYAKKADGSFVPSAPNDSISGIINQQFLVSGAYKEDWATTLTALTGNTASSIQNYFWTGLSSATDKTNAKTLMVYNKTETAYGYRSSTASVAANSFAEISLFVKTANLKGKLNFYLVDSTGKVIQYSGLVAEYEKDEDGKDTDKVISTTPVAEKELKIENITATEWTEVKFYVATGSNALSYSIEAWMGSRDGSTLASGMMFIDTASTTTLYAGSSLTAKQKLEAFNNDYVKPNENNATVFTINYAEPVLYVEKDNSGTNDKDDTTDEEPEPEAVSGFDWVMLSSILIAVALLFAVGAVVYKKAKSSKFFKKKKVHVGEVSYSRNKMKNSDTKISEDDSDNDDETMTNDTAEKESEDIPSDDEPKQD